MQPEAVHVAVHLDQRILHLQHVRVARVQRLLVPLQPLLEGARRPLELLQLLHQRPVAGLDHAAGRLVRAADRVAAPHRALVHRVGRHHFAAPAPAAHDRAAERAQLGRVLAALAQTVEALGVQQMGAPLDAALQQLRVGDGDQLAAGNVHGGHHRDVEVGVEHVPRVRRAVVREHRRLRVDGAHLGAEAGRPDLEAVGVQDGGDAHHQLRIDVREVELLVQVRDEIEAEHMVDGGAAADVQVVFEGEQRLVAGRRG